MKRPKTTKAARERAAKVRAEVAARKALQRLDEVALAAAGAVLASDAVPPRKRRKKHRKKPNPLVRRFPGAGRLRNRPMTALVLEKRIVDRIKASSPEGVDLETLQAEFPDLGDFRKAVHFLTRVSERWHVGKGEDGLYREGKSSRARRPWRKLEKSPDGLNGHERWVLGLLRDGRKPPLYVKAETFEAICRAGCLEKVPTKDAPEAFPSIFDYRLVEP